MQDKILPQAVDAEETVIGTILAYPDSINNVMAILTPDMFYKVDLQNIYKSCLEIIQRSGGVDLITVSNELKGKVDIIYLTELSGRVVSSQMIENHAFLIKEKYLLRKYIQAGNELANMAFTEDLQDVSEKAEMDILNISGLLHIKEPKKLGVLIDDAINDIDKLRKKEISLIGVPSGFTTIDRITGGFKKGELTIVAGRPSMGKTAAALQFAKNAAELNNPVLMFSCEMAQFEQALRFLSGVSGYSNVDLITGRVDIDKLLKDSEPLLNLGIYIDDTPAITLLELRAKSRKMILKYGIKIIIVDYIQLMQGIGQSREQEVSYLSRGLKAIAKDMNVPVIALSQLNRDPEAKADRRPQLANLRESGAIEQDADMVMLLYRPAYYRIATYSINGKENRDTNGLMVINLAKNRNGCTGELMFHHNESMTVINEKSNSI
jgi:replicative DNA helicase